MSVPWFKVSKAVGTSSAPGPPQSHVANGVSEKRKDKIPNKLSKKLKEFEANFPVDSDVKESTEQCIKTAPVEEPGNDWNPMKEDYKSPSFNSYTKGPGALLNPDGLAKACTLFVDKIPVGYTRDALSNLFSRCGKVQRATVIKNENSVSTFGFIEYGTMKEADAALQQLNNFYVGKGLKLVVKVSTSENKHKTKNEQDGRGGGMMNSRASIDKTMDSMPNSPVASRLSTSPTPSIGPKGRGFTNLSNSMPSTMPHNGTGGFNETQRRPGGINSASQHSLPSNYLNVSANNSNTGLTTPGGFASSHRNDKSTGNSLHVRDHDLSAKSSCQYCGQDSTKKCAVCRTPYCSQECQAKDWPTHKLDCKKLAQDLEATIGIKSVDAEICSMRSNGDDTAQQHEQEELNDLVNLMTHVNIKPSAIASNSSDKPCFLTPPPEDRITSPVGPASGNNKPFYISYKDFNAAFSVVPPSLPLPSADLSNQLPQHFFGLVTLVVSSCRFSVFPMDNSSRRIVDEFLDYEKKMLTLSEMVTSLPDNMQMFGYKCGNGSFHRVEVNSSTTQVSALDTGEQLGTLDRSRLFVLPDKFLSIPALRVKLSLKNVDHFSDNKFKGKVFLSNALFGKVVKVVNPRMCHQGSIPFVLANVFSMDGSVDYNKLVVDSGYAVPRANNTAQTKSSNIAKPSGGPSGVQKKDEDKTHKNYPGNARASNEPADDTLIGDRSTQMKGVAKKVSLGLPNIGRGSVFNYTNDATNGVNTSEPPSPLEGSRKPLQQQHVSLPPEQHCMSPPKLAPVKNDINKLPPSTQSIAIMNNTDKPAHSTTAMMTCTDKHLPPPTSSTNDKPTATITDYISNTPPPAVKCIAGHQVIPMLTLPTGSISQMIVIHVDSPHLFYIMRLGTAQDYVRLSESIQTASMQPAVDDVKIGDFCLAKLSRDSHYSRVEILKLKPNKALLRFIDYGIKQPVFIKDLRAIEEQFCILPQQAIACTLSNVDPQDEKWSKNSISYFAGLVLNKRVDVKVLGIMEGNVHRVEMLLESSLDLAADLKAKGYTNSKVPPPPSSLPLDSSSVNVTPVDSKSCSDLKVTPLMDGSMVVVATVVSMDEFYVQLLSEDSKQNVNKVVMSEFNGEPMVTPLRIDSLCCAKFAEDGQWYRARVVAPPSDNDRYDVHFIDFGNYASVASSDISKCPESLYGIPVLASKCSLYGVNRKDAAMLESFKSLTNEKLVTIGVVKAPSSTDGLWSVTLIDSSGPCEVNIASCLNAQSASPIVNQGSPSEPPPSSPCSSPVPAVSQGGPPSTVAVPPAVIPAPNDHVKVMITEIINPSKFYVEFLTKEWEQSFVQGLCVQLPLKYKDPFVYTGFNASVGSYCCAKFSQDDCWYRCKVLEVSNDQARLLYIDYGNTDIVSLNDLYHLDPVFAGIPAQGVSCSLDNISPFKGSQWSHASVEYFKSIGGNPLFAVVKLVEDDIVNVDLYLDEGCTQGVGDAMVKNSLAVSGTCPMYTIPLHELLQPDASECIEVVVSDASSFTSLYIQVALPEVQQVLATLQSNLASYANSVSLPPSYRPKVGDFCCALFSEDECWYRAMVTGVSDGGSMVTVLYVDFGNTSEVSISNIRLLNKELARYPQVACQVALAGVDSTDVSLLQSFKSLVDGKLLSMKIVTSSTKPVQVELYAESAEESINSQLLQHAAPTKPVGRASNEPLPSIDRPYFPSGDAFKGMVVHIESGREFYVQVTESNNVQNLVELMENVNKCSKTAEPLSLPVFKDQLCLAQFSGDYYRGRIIEVSGEYCRVFFVDYGNTDVVCVSDMKAVPAALLASPAQALKCSLVGVSGKSSIDPEVKTKFASFVDGVEVICSIVCKHPLIIDVQRDTSSPSFAQMLMQEGVTPTITNCVFDVELLTPPKPGMSGTAPVVMVTEVENPNVLWLQMYDKKTLTDFEKVTIEMNQYCCQTEPQPYPILMGQMCCAKFAVDESWYRCRVIGFADEDCVVVQFIDFGNTQVTPASLVRNIPSSLLALPAQGIPCALNNYKGSDTDKLKQLFLNNQFSCVVKDVSLASGGVLLIDLFDCDSGAQRMP